MNAVKIWDTLGNIPVGRLPGKRQGPFKEIRGEGVGVRKKKVRKYEVN